MTIEERIEADMQSAMKQRNELELGTLRLVRSVFKNKQIELGKPITNDDVRSVLSTMKKQYLDALSDFEKAGRTDLADRQRKELEIIERYLPAAFSEGELEEVVRGAVEASGVTDASGFGKAMGVAMKAVEGRADGNRVRAIVQRLLNPPGD